METTNQYPPIDRELVETVWPSLLEQQADGAKLSADEFQRQVARDADALTPDLEHGGAVQVEETTIRDASGAGDLSVLILRPKNARGPLPCIYYTSNGGKMQCSTKVALTEVEAQWVAELNVAFISIAPRVGPAHPHPAQVEDAFAGLIWITQNAEALNIDPGRIILMGKSGGGGVAAATALYARDSAGPAITHQMLIYPMIDDRDTNASSQFDVAPWTASNNRVGWSAILGDSAGGPDVSPYAAPARATDLSGLPPAYVEVGSSEVFRDESLDYAARLAKAGVPMELHSWDGGFHAFEISAPDSNIGRACVAARRSYVERAIYASAP